MTAPRVAAMKTPAKRISRAPNARHFLNPEVRSAVTSARAIGNTSAPAKWSALIEAVVPKTKFSRDSDTLDATTVPFIYIHKPYAAQATPPAMTAATSVRTSRSRMRNNEKHAKRPNNDATVASQLKLAAVFTDHMSEAPHHN